MAEDFEIINQQTEGGNAEFLPEDLVAIRTVYENLDDLTAIANALSGGGLNVSSVDGNSTPIKLRRGTVADLTTANAVYAEGELIFAKDASPQDIRVGDGVTHWADLPNIFVNVDFTLAELNDAVATVEAARTTVLDARTETGEFRDEANDAVGDAQDWSEQASDFANAPEGTSLPGGGDSALVSKLKAASIVALNRKIPRRGTVGTASEAYDPGYLEGVKRYAPSSAINITINPNTFTSVDDVEAWGIVRNEGSGSVKFVPAAGGTNLQTPIIKQSGTLIRRCTAAEFVNAAINIAFTLPSVPAITQGRLIIFATMINNTSTASALSLALSNSLTSSKILAEQAGLSVQVPNMAVFSVPLSAFAGGDVTATFTAGIYIYSLSIDWFVLEGVDPADTGIVRRQVANANATGTGNCTLPAVPAQSLVMASARCRGGTDDVAFSSLSTSLALIESVNSAGKPDTSIADANDQRNIVCARGSAAPATLADFVAAATFSAAFSRPGIVLLSYSPITVTGAGDVVLHLEGGRDTLTEAYSEAELRFYPNGKDIVVKIGKV